MQIIALGYANYVIGGTQIRKIIAWEYSNEKGSINIYRQSPIKSPDIKNIIVVTFTFLLKFLIA